NRVRGSRLAVPELGNPIVHEDGVADEYRVQEPPIADAEEGNRSLAQLSRPCPPESVGVGKPEHASRDATPDLTVAGVYVARMQLGVIAGQAGEAYEVSVGDGPAGTAEGHPCV